MTAEDEGSRTGPGADVYIGHDDATRVLRRAGFPDEYIAGVFGDITFPVTRSALLRRGADFGISAESLMDQLGGSP